MTFTQPLTPGALRALTPGAVFYEQSIQNDVFTVTVTPERRLHVTDSRGVRQPNNEWDLDFAADMVELHDETYYFASVTP